MRLNLGIVGPVDIPFQKKKKNVKYLKGPSLRSCWANAIWKAVAKKKGCYVFALRASKGFMPWYVGKTKKQTMKNECLKPYQLGLYNDVLTDGHKGTPVMFFVVPAGSKNSLPGPVIEELEKFLIQTAVYRNPQLQNTHNTKNLPDWGITGVVRSGQGKPRANEKAFRKMMRL